MAIGIIRYYTDAVPKQFQKRSALKLSFGTKIGINSYSHDNFV